jgi:hypothetical protein
MTTEGVALARKEKRYGFAARLAPARNSVRF